MSKTATAPVRFVDGDFAFIECACGAGVKGHIYHSKPDAWISAHCGSPTRPATPPELPQPHYVEPPPPPTQPSRLRLRLQSGEVEMLPVTSPHLEVVVREQGVHPDEPERLIVRRPLHELASLTAVYEGEKK